MNETEDPIDPSVDQTLENKNLERMLEFETQMFLDVLYKDGLVIGAKGLNLDLVILNLIKVYCDPGNLVFVLNSYESEEKWFVDKVKDDNIHIITSATPVSVREDIYLSGGIHFITTRILVVDMLKKRVPIEKITGFIILRAHKIMESCQEAFVIRLYRQNNKTGFIKAFSNSAQSFTMGFGHVERIMRALFVKELYIWPRFHSLVISNLKKHEPQVIELHVPISENVRKAQTYILELMNMMVKELKRLNKTVELEEITAENCLTRKFHKILQSQLDLIWHQLSSKSRQLVADLKTLRHLIITLFYSDPLTFHSLLSSYRKIEYASSSNWVLLKPAELLFTHSSSLVYTADKELNPEFCPKWKTLFEILKVEIPHEIEKSKSKDNKILILCSDHKTCHQLNELLIKGPYYYMFAIALKHGIRFKTVNEQFKSCGDLPKVQSQELAATDQDVKKSKKPKKDGELNEKDTSTDKDTSEDTDDQECYRNSYVLTMSQSKTSQENETLVSEAADGDEYSFSQLENMDFSMIFEKVTAPTILIQTFKGAENYINLERTLEALKPSFIVMYHCNITTIREIEMYEAHRQNDAQLKVYFLIHAGTVEEQSYLTSLRREKEAFEHLIRTKAVMVVPEDQDGKSEDCANLLRDSLKSPTKSTRHGGKEDETKKKQFVIVDMREFRSELPALIHRRGIEIEPLTITIGDYILTPDICIERKSVSDLIGSLKSGRLYQQCNQMARFYTKPMLLIEFDQNKNFSWQNYMVSSDRDDFEGIQKKLLLLTIHFPKLRIIWSPSPYASAQLFEELKQNKDEPNIEYAATVGAELDMDVIHTKYNSNIYDAVRKLPGITSKNIDTFLRQTKNMSKVVQMSQDDLKNVLGNSSDAAAFYSILHEEHMPEDESETKSKWKGKSKFKYCKSK